MTVDRGGLVDVAGLRVGHATADADGFLTGTTVVLAPPGGMVAGVDVRGGAPGTRETDLLDPAATVERVHALVLTGGSAYGLASATGVADALGELGVGFPVGPEPGHVVPIVPAAVVFDLGRGGVFTARPDAGFGRSAVRAALSGTRAEMLAEGSVGAGTGVCLGGGLRGGLGQAATPVPGGGTVGCLVVVNATGSPVDPATGELWAARSLTAADGPAVGRPSEQDRDRLREQAERSGGGLRVGGHTTIGVVATDLTLTKAQCAKLAAMAHDGLARAVNPVHTQFDGDLFFGASTAQAPPPEAGHLFALLAAAADTATRAVGRAVLAARSVTTPAATWPGYLDLAPSARPAEPRPAPDDRSSR